jgi:hypothetical protein
MSSSGHKGKDGRKWRSIFVCEDERDDDAGEFFGLFEVHEMAGVAHDDAARIGDASFDDVGMTAKSIDV